MKIFQPIKSIVLFITIMACFTSCTKDDLSSDSNFSGISVKLKSTTGELDKVFLEIEDVELKIKDTNEASAWISLNAINKGNHNAYDLSADGELELVNNFEIEASNIYEIRLVLGNNNFLDLHGILHSLDVTYLGNATPSNLLNTKIIKQRFYEFVIHIDIDESIRFNEDENIMVLDPKLYTEIRQVQY